MRFSRFFIARPIFAIVLSLFITIVGAHRLLAGCRHPVSRDHAADDLGLRDLFRRQRPDRRRYRRRRHRAGGQRRRRHDLHVLAVDAATARMTPHASRSRSAPTSTRRRCWCRTASPRPSRACPKRCAAPASRCARTRPTCCSSVHLVSPDKSYDQVYISNYALLNVRDVLARIEGVGRGQPVRRPRILDARLARPGAHRGASA